MRAAMGYREQGMFAQLSAEQTALTTRTQAGIQALNTKAKADMDAMTTRNNASLTAMDTLTKAELSAFNTRASSSLQALQTRTKASMDALNMRSQASGFTSEAIMADGSAAGISPFLSGTSSLLGSAGNVLKSWNTLDDAQKANVSSGLKGWMD
jgi:hypothetical protein